MKLKAKTKEELRRAIIDWFESDEYEFADDRGEGGLVLDGRFHIDGLVDALVETEESEGNPCPVKPNKESPVWLECGLTPDEWNHGALGEDGRKESAN